MFQNFTTLKSFSLVSRLAKPLRRVPGQLNAQKSSGGRGLAGRLIFLVLILGLAFVNSGCSCSEGDTTNAFGPSCGESVADTGSGDSTGTGTILVSDLANSSIRKFTSISSLNSPTQTNPSLTGSLTRLTRPGFLAVHPTTGDLIVPDEGTSAILFFENPTDLTGDIAPKRILVGVNTQLSGPVQVFVDGTTDELYVLDKAKSEVLVFSDSSTIDGAVAPLRRIGGGSSSISSPSAFIFRPANDQMLVLNPTEILVFENFRTASGGPVPIARFGGAATTMSNLSYGELTDSGTLLLCDNGGNKLLSFDSWQFDQTNVAPTRVISGGNTSLTAPRQFARVGNTLYLADSGNVLVFEGIDTLQGDNFPTRKFSGLNPNTQTLQGLLVR